MLDGPTRGTFLRNTVAKSISQVNHAFSTTQPWQTNRQSRVFPGFLPCNSSNGHPPRPSWAPFKPNPKEVKEVSTHVPRRSRMSLPDQCASVHKSQGSSQNVNHVKLYQHCHSCLEARGQYWQPSGNDPLTLLYGQAELLTGWDWPTIVSTNSPKGESKRR